MTVPLLPSSAPEQHGVPNTSLGNGPRTRGLTPRWPLQGQASTPRQADHALFTRLACVLQRGLRPVGQLSGFAHPGSLADRGGPRVTVFMELVARTVGRNTYVTNSLWATWQMT